MLSLKFREFSERSLALFHWRCMKRILAPLTLFLGSMSYSGYPSYPGYSGYPGGGPPAPMQQTLNPNPYGGYPGSTMGYPGGNPGMQPPSMGGMNMGMTMGMGPGGMPQLPPLLSAVGISIGVSSAAAGGSWWQPFYGAVPQADMGLLQAWFTHSDTDRSGALSANEICRIDWSGPHFSREVAHRICRLFDSDKNGQVDFNEFVGLFWMVNELNAAFRSHDRDRSYSLDGNEILAAINQLGFNVTMPIIQRFCNAWVPFAPSQSLSWEQFILLGAQLHYIRRNIPFLQAAGPVTLDNLITFVLDLL